MDDVDELLPPRPERRRFWLALVLTAAAVPLLVIDNLPGGEPAPSTTSVPTVAVSQVDVPFGSREPTGPAKGVSVVTSSTTSSTRPITTTTTTTTTPPGRATTTAPFTSIDPVPSVRVITGRAGISTQP